MHTFSPVCRGRYRYLSCDGGRRVSIVSVFFGRNNRDPHCRAARSFLSRNSNPDSSGCSVAGAADVFKDQCDGRGGCWVYHSLLDSIRDTCSHVEKYIRIEYRCT